MAFTENYTLRELVDETTLIKDDVTNNRDTLKANLNTIGMDTGGISNLGELIQKVKELYCLDVVPGTDFVYKSDVKELKIDIDSRNINYMEHYKNNDDIYVIYDQEYSESGNKFYAGYIVKYNFSTGELNSQVLFTRATIEYKIQGVYFLDKYVYICYDRIIFKKISLDDLTVIASLDIGISSYNCTWHNGCEIKHMNNKLYLTIGGSSRASACVLKIDINSFSLEKSYTLGSASMNSDYLLYSLNFMTIDLEVSCIYVSAVYSGQSRIFKLDDNLNLISKTADRNVPRGDSIIKNNLILVGAGTVNILDISTDYSKVFTKDNTISLGFNNTVRGISKSIVDGNLYYVKGHLFYTKIDDYTNTQEINLPPYLESIDMHEDGNISCCTKNEYIKFKRKKV